MTLYETLRAQAARGAASRGHSMQRFSRNPRDSYTGNESGQSVCRVCGATAHIDTRPAPNGIDIGGSAVAVNCPETNS